MVLKKCIFSNSNQYLATGGINNVCTIFKTPENYDDFFNTKIHQNKIILKDHIAYISDIKFINDDYIYTTSGDSTIKLWDINNQSVISTFISHNDDVTCIELLDELGNIFVTGSIDRTLKIWDKRENNHKRPFVTIPGHQANISSLAIMSNKTNFASGSSNGSIRLWDIRALKQLNRYSVKKEHNNEMPTINAISFSSSNRLLFAI